MKASPLLLVLLLALVTYIPRYVPFLFSGKLKAGPFTERFLGFVPAAALGALIFPGILQSGVERSYATVAGAVAAVAVSALGGGLVAAVVASVGATCAALLLAP